MDEIIIKCEICGKTFSSKEALEMHNAAKHPEKILKQKKPFPVKKTRNWILFILVVGIVGWLLFSVFSGIKTLPPTDIQGHIESNPSSHILKEPMPLVVQKHMLEHVDGVEGGRGGVIINYNCEDYSCEVGLIENLEAFAEKYNYVYVAPFKNMDAKIALTKLNRIEILEFYDEGRIDSFIVGF